MTWKLKGSLLAAAVVSAGLASQTQAAFTYDLRLAPGQTGATDTHDVTLDTTNPAAIPATYTLQLWGQISGDSNLTNDGYVIGFVGITSAQGTGGAFTSGGVSAAQLGLLASSTQGATVGAGPSNITNDGISDWGTTSTTNGSESSYFRWGGLPTPGTPDGAPVLNQSEVVNATTWEILLGTFTVTVGNLGTTGGTTSFSVFAPSQISFNTIGGKQAGLIYTQDGTTNTLATPTGDTSVVFTATGGGGVTTPEPASLGLLALGGLALMNRRRKA